MRLFDIIKQAKVDRSYAYVVPLAAFMALNFVLMIIADSGLEWKHDLASWWRHWPEHWFYPLQTIICGGLLIYCRKQYQFDLKWDRRVLVGVIMGVIGIGFWILPTHLYTVLGYTEESAGWLKHLGVAPRDEGFDPQVLDAPWAIWTTTIFRFLRAVVIVAFVEEIFWRGFLMRFLLDRDGNYWKVPFGKFSWLTFAAVTACFVFIHGPVDYAGAVVYGTLTYFVAVWTKSLAACITMHATANLLMGIYALQFGKFGLW